jgi:hypothetical protein
MTADVPQRFDIPETLPSMYNCSVMQVSQKSDCTRRGYGYHNYEAILLLLLRSADTEHVQRTV